MLLAIEIILLDVIPIIRHRILVFLNIFLTNLIPNVSHKGNIIVWGVVYYV